MTPFVADGSSPILRVTSGGRLDRYVHLVLKHECNGYVDAGGGEIRFCGETVMLQCLGDTGIDGRTTATGAP